MELSLTQRINQVFSDLLRSKSELCHAAIKDVASQYLTEKEDVEAGKKVDKITKNLQKLAIRHLNGKQYSTIILANEKKTSQHNMSFRATAFHDIIIYHARKT